LFSLEEASTHWSHATTWRSLTCAALAVFVSAVARALTPREGVFSAKSSASLMSLSGSTGLIPIPYARDGLARSERSNASTATPSSSESRDASAYFLWELPLFAALAAVAAVIGALLTRSSSALSSRRPKTPRARVLEAALVSGACAAIAIIAAAAFGACASRPTNKATLSGSSDADGGDYVFGLVCPRGRANDLGTLLLGLRDDIISDLLSSSSDFTPTSIAIALVILLVTIPIACDCSFPAGLFMPTIAWGACLGSLWGVAARELVRRIAGADVANAVSPGSYAVVGAASALAGMFRSSISLVVIMVEGTGRVGALMPLILGVAVANIVGPKVHDESFYEAQLRAKGVPFLRQHHACAPASPRKSHGESHDAFSTQCTVESLIKNPPRCLTPIPHVGCIEDLLLSATHNGFPVVLCDPPALEADSDASRRAGNGKLVGFILRSQLMVLLARREFLERFDACDDNSFNVTLDRIDSNDTAMRTFHHRHHFGDRGISSSAEAVRRLGLTTDERSKRIDLWNYMKLAPLAVHAQCSAWRAAGYFRAAGLRHLPVVDFNNRVGGVLTRRDLVPGFGTQGEGEGADGYADMRARAFLCNDWSDEDEDTDQAVSSKDVTLSNVVTFSL
jgi:chloride channel 7